MTLSDHTKREVPFSSRSRWWVLLASFFTLLFITLIFSSFISTVCHNPRIRILIISAFQSLVTFALPVWITWNLTSTRPYYHLGLSSKPRLRAFLGIIILYIIATPAMNQLIFWNAGIKFPDSMAGLEEELRRWEDSAGSSVAILLSDTSIPLLLINIIVVGIITGFGEEMLFRGGLQRMMTASGINPVASIWIAAFIFSTIHLQFFGFFPRLIMGAYFGYLLYWSESLWNAIIAHALNNSLVVASTWLTIGKIFPENSEYFGVVASGIPWPCIGSAVLTALFLWKFRKFFFYKADR